MKDHVGKRIRECMVYQEILEVIDDWMEYYNKDRYQWGLAKLALTNIIDTSQQVNIHQRKNPPEERE